MPVLGHVPTGKLIRLVAALSGVTIAGLAMVPAASAATVAPAHVRSGPDIIPRVPSGCEYGSDGEHYAEVYCFYGTGQFRIAITCTTGIIRYGSWEAAGGGITSSARCPTNTFLIDYNADFD